MSVLRSPHLAAALLLSEAGCAAAVLLFPEGAPGVLLWRAGAHASLAALLLLGARRGRPLPSSGDGPRGRGERPTRAGVSGPGGRLLRLRPFAPGFLLLFSGGTVLAARLSPGDADALWLRLAFVLMLAGGLSVLGAVGRVRDGR